MYCPLLLLQPQLRPTGRGRRRRAPVAAGATSATNPSGCITPAPPATTHTFDSADRLADTGYTYDTFGHTGSARGR